MAAELTHSKSGIETVILINILALHKFEGYIFPCFFIKKPCHCQQNRSFVKKKMELICLFMYVTEVLGVQMLSYFKLQHFVEIDDNLSMSKDFYLSLIVRAS